MSLKLALNQLGFGPCYHASEMFSHPERIPLWVQAGDGDADWEAVFAGYRATTDAPGCFFWRELTERYPDAKVLHSVRDPLAWFDSGQATVFGPNSLTANPPPAAKPFFDMLARRRGAMSLQDRDEMLAWFERHTEEVRAAIPADRLLVFEVTQGWGPLCAFLGAPVPDTPFPKTNERAELAARMAQFRNSDGEIDVDRLREGLDRPTN
jgi:hypothetical protein